MTYNFDPELVDFIDALPSTDISDPAALRQSRAEMGGISNTELDTSSLDISDLKIPGPEGDPDVSVRIYRPKQPRDNGPGLFYIHGGGFVLGSVDGEHAASASIAMNLNIVVVSVEYRLAPEFPYPAPLEDCYAALQWFSANAHSLGVDNTRIGICGQSAGGGLSAGTALLARDRNGPELCFQYLGIPEVDDRLDTPSMTQFVDTPMWARPNAEMSWKFYLGDNWQPGGADVPIYAAPSRATDLSGLPPAFVTVMEFDPLRDEGINYAMKLLECGVSTELHAYPGTFHGSSLVVGAKVSQRAGKEMMEALARGLGLND
jgi:acetyl esterase